MATRGVHTLKWRVGRPEALREISGVATAVGLESGSEVLVTIDHTPGEPEDEAAEADFAFAPDIRVSAVGYQEIGDLVFTVCCQGMSDTGFTLLVSASDVWDGGDPGGYGGYGPADVEFTWHRRGVLNGPE